MYVAADDCQRSAFLPTHHHIAFVAAAVAPTSERYTEQSYLAYA